MLEADPAQPTFIACRSARNHPAEKTEWCASHAGVQFDRHPDAIRFLGIPVSKVGLLAAVPWTSDTKQFWNSLLERRKWREGSMRFVLVPVSHREEIV